MSSPTQATSKPTSARGVIRMGQRTQRQPKSASACHNGRKPKGPMLNTSQDKRLQAPPRAGFCHAQIQTGARLLALAWLRADGPIREDGRTACPVCSTSAHPLPLNRPRVVPESRQGALTMTVISLAARTVAPITIPAGRTAAPTFNDTTDPAQIALHAAAENALSMALALLRDPSGTAQDLQRATARAIRAATLLKRACAQAEGGAA